MNIFQVVNKLYTTKDCVWLTDVDTKSVSSVVVFKFLAFNNSREVVKKLNRAVFKLQPLHFLYYAWALLPKTQTAPTTKYFKKQTTDKWDWLLDKYSRYLEVGDNSITPYKQFLISHIEQNTVEWFKFFGVEPKICKKYGVKL